MITRSKSKINDKEYKDGVFHKQHDALYDELDSASQHSSSSHTSVLRLKEEQKRAELAAKAVALKEHHELELKRRQLDIEHKRKQETLRLEQQRLDDDAELSKLEFQQLEAEFNIQTEIAISDAKSKVILILDRFEDGNYVTKIKLPYTCHHETVVNPDIQTVDYGAVFSEQGTKSLPVDPHVETVDYPRDVVYSDVYSDVVHSDSPLMEKMASSRYI